MQNNLFQGTLRSLAWVSPQGQTIFSNITLNLGHHRYGLVGPNGVGKSTLAKILAGELKPDEGLVQMSQPVTYLAQEQERAEVTVADYLNSIWENPLLDSQLWIPLLGNLEMDRTLSEHRFAEDGSWVLVVGFNLEKQNTVRLRFRLCFGFNSRFFGSNGSSERVLSEL